MTEQMTTRTRGTEVKSFGEPAVKILDSEFVAAALILQTHKLTELECKIRGLVTGGEYDDIFRRHLRKSLEGATMLAKHDMETFKCCKGDIRKIGIRFDLAL